MKNKKIQYVQGMLILAIGHELINIKRVILMITYIYRSKTGLDLYDIALILIQFYLIKLRKIYISFQRRSNFTELIFMIVDEFIKRIINAT